MAIIDDDYNGKLEKSALASWHGNSCQLYVLSTGVVIIEDDNHHQHLKNHTLEQCNSKEKLAGLIQLDSAEDYDEILDCIDTLLNKERSDTEVNNIVKGLQQISREEIFLPMQIYVRGSRISSIALGILIFIIFIFGIVSGNAWLKNNNPVDDKIFMAITLVAFFVSFVGAYIVYRLYNKVQQVNKTDNFGIWLTKKYLITHDGNAGLQYVPLKFIKDLKTYQSGRPPLQMVIAETKKPFTTLRLVCNYLTAWQTPQQLKALIQEKIIAFEVPQQYLSKTGAAIAYANTYEDSKKMYLLTVQLEDMITANACSPNVLGKLAKYIDLKISQWNDQVKIIPEEWVFEKEVNENWEYGVNGVTYSEKWNDIRNPGHWMIPLGRIFIVNTIELKDFFDSPSIVYKMIVTLAKAPLQKIIIKIPIREDAKQWLKDAIAGQENLKKTQLVFDS